MFRHGFESGGVLGNPGAEAAQRGVVAHAMTAEEAHAGRASERFIFQPASQPADDIRIEFPVTDARVFNELTASLWVKANTRNLRLGVGIRYPHHIDPRTNEPIAVDLVSQSFEYTNVGGWQQLTFRTDEETVRSRVIRLRSQLREAFGQNKLDDREPYVDRVILIIQPPPDRSELLIDDLELGPVVEPLTTVTTDPASARPQPILSILDDRIRRRGEPFFLLSTLYHGESLELIGELGVNTVWIPDYRDRPLLQALSEMGIGAIAQPPHPPPEDTILNRASMPSFPDWTSPVVAWILGREIPPGDRPHVAGWSRQVKDADRQLRRPVLADVAGDERDFHRHLDLMASSQFYAHSALNPIRHSEDLRLRRDLALPGKPMFAVVQTEASEALLDYLGERTALPVVEPEQILHQGYEAIAAGFKGILFWKQIPFETEASGLVERHHSMRIFCLHSQVLQPFLATSRVFHDIPVLSEGAAGATPSGITAPLRSRWDTALTPNGRPVPVRGESAEIRATVLQTDHGLMVVPVWHEPGAQCVPGPQTVSKLRMLVRGVGDATQVWEVTPTSVSQSNLDLERVSGGTEITLKEFDRHSVLVITNHITEIDRLRERIRATRHEAAESYLLMAEAKLARVRETHRELSKVTSPIPHGDEILAQADRILDIARQDFAANRDDDVRRNCLLALQRVRGLQRRYWQGAVDLLNAPTATAEATSFQTLPDHWKLISQLNGSGGLSPNQLPSGDFEDERAIGEQWRDGSPENRNASLRLSTERGPHGRFLTMLVQPETRPGQPAVVISPEISVKEGDLIVITGEVSVPYPLQQSHGDFLIFETLLGRQGAFRYPGGDPNWSSFRMVRRAPRDGSFRMRLELHSPGVANVDNLSVRIASPQPGTILRAGHAVQE